MTMNTSRRRALYAGVAAAAVLTGAGVAWQRQRENALSPLVLERLWASEFDTPSGELLKLSRFQGGAVVINFWATWCPPCVEEIPLLDRFFQQNSSKGWQVIGLAIDQPTPVRRFLGQSPVSYPIGLAGFGGTELGQLLGNVEGSLPFTVVLTPLGALKYRKVGKLSDDDLKSWV